jgi:hypothetical protein
MKVKRAVEIAGRWAAGDADRGMAVFRRLAALDPELQKDFEEEAAQAYVERLAEEFLEQGYSLERPAELIAAIVNRLKLGPEDC